MEPIDPACERTEHRSGFTENQKASAYPPGIEGHFWLQSRCRIVCDKIRTAGAASPVLDLGCGPGITVDHLRRRGIECYGADLVTYRPVAPDLGGALWYGKDAFDLSASCRGRFGTVLLLDVLEHILDPRAFVRRCIEAFPNVKHLLITLPARQELWSNYDEFYGHHRRYDLESAAELCREAGTEVIECGYFFHALYAAMALQRLLSVGRSVELNPIRHQHLHGILSLYFYLEEKLLPGAIPGSSLLITARVRH